MTKKAGASYRIHGSNRILNLSRSRFGLFPGAVIYGKLFRSAPSFMFGVYLLKEAN